MTIHTIQGKLNYNEKNMVQPRNIAKKKIVFLLKKMKMKLRKVSKKLGRMLISLEN
jgi:hypothetical protein